MKKVVSIVCAVLLVIGAVVAWQYATQEVKTLNDQFGVNGNYYVDENGTEHKAQYYFDIGNTKESKIKKQKAIAGCGYCVYAIAVVGAGAFVMLRHETFEPNTP